MCMLLYFFTLALPEVGNHEEVVGEDEDEDAGSMFPFNEEDLIYGMVAEVLISKFSENPFRTFTTVVEPLLKKEGCYYSFYF